MYSDLRHFSYIRASTIRCQSETLHAILWV